MKISRKILRSASYFISNDETKLQLCFIHAQKESNKTIIQATNGHSAISISFIHDETGSEDLLIPTGDHLKAKKKKDKNEILDIYQGDKKTIVHTEQESKWFSVPKGKYPDLNLLFKEAKNNVKEYAPSSFAINPELFCLLSKSIKEFGYSKINWYMPENTDNAIYCHQTIENINWEAIVMPCSK